MYSDPMPGENFENAAEREKALAEKEAIANGESFNPNLSAEDIEGFNSLENEVQFAGDTYAEDQTEKEPAAEYSTQTGTKEDDPTSNSENTVVGKIVGSAYDTGVAPDLKAVKESVGANYIEGVEQEVFTDKAALGATNEAIRNTNVDEEEAFAQNDTTIEQGNQPKDSAVAASELAIGVSAQAEDIVNELKGGNVDAATAGSNFEENLIKTQQAIDSIENAVSMNGNSQEALVANDLKHQAQEMKDEAEQQFNEAKEKFNAMSEEEKEEAQEAEKQAEMNGTSIDEELEKLEETKKKLAEEEENMRANVQNDIAAGIFG